MLEPAATEEEQPTESQRVVFRRFTEARNAGLTLVEARLFAESDVATSGCYASSSQAPVRPRASQPS